MKQVAWKALTSPRFTGAIEAQGLWFPSRSVSPQVALQRALVHYAPGAGLYVTALGVIVEFATRTLDCNCSGGAPLQRRGELLVSAAFDRPTIDSLPGAKLLLLDAGRVHALDPSDCRAIDLAALVAWNGAELEQVTSLGKPPAPPAVLETTEDPSKQLGTRLGRDAGESERAAAIAQWNERFGQTAVQADSGTGTSTSPRARWLAQGVAAIARAALGSLQLMGAVVGALVYMLGGATPSWLDDTTQGSETRAMARAENTKPKRRWWHAWTRSAERWLERLAHWSGFTKAQTRYMQDLLSLLDQHNDLEALKRAIPLGGAGGAEGSAALLPPKPRANLGISLRLWSGGSALRFHSDVYTHLQRAYERMFERLDSANRYDEASFVLAELLRDAARAVAYLERRGQLRLAAELAEGRNLAADLLVRQWFIAGDRERAVAIAVREHVFAQAIARLEKLGESEAAAALSLLYAERLAAAGHLVHAAKVIGHIGQARGLALGWLALARTNGECAGLALELSWRPALFAEVLQAVQPLLDGEDSADVAGRTSLARELLAQRSHAARPIARALARRLIADAGRNWDSDCLKLAIALGDWVGGALAADTPSVAAHSLRGHPPVLRRRYTPAAASGACIYDVHRFGRHWLVAQGESGVALLDRHGKRIAQFDTPAEQLIVAPNSPHVLALAKRGGAYRVSRIHAATRRAELWTELSLHAFSNTFDGEHWPVVLGDGKGDPNEAETGLSILDVLGEQPRVLKRLPLGRDVLVRQIRCLPDECYVVAADPLGWPDLLRYALPSWQLRSRAVYPGAEQSKRSRLFGGTFSADEAGPCWVDLWSDYDPENPATLLEPKWTGPSLCRNGLQLEIPHATPIDWNSAQLVARLRYFAVATVGAGGGVRAGSFSSQQLSLELVLQDSSATTLRLEPPWLYFGDRAGRIFLYDVQLGRELAVITPH